MNRTLSVFAGACRYEWRMQIRRPALWITFLIVELLIVGVMVRVTNGFDSVLHLERYPVLQSVVSWTNIVNYLLPVIAGILIADRLPRDRRTNMHELLATFPSSQMARLSGKFLGNVLATGVPIVLFYLFGCAVILVETRNLLVLPLAIGTFAAIVLPGLLFVGAFSIALPALLWVPLYQFLFLAYWFWGNIYVPRNIPTISTTLLTPAGGYMSRGFFGMTLFPVAHATAAQGVESLLLLLVITWLVMLTLNAYLRWQQDRQ